MKEKKPFTDAPIPLAEDAVFERTGKKIPEVALETFIFADVVASPDVIPYPD